MTLASSRNSSQLRDFNDGSHKFCGKDSPLPTGIATPVVFTCGAE